MLRTPLGRLRAMGLLEGASFLLLLGVAMPLKYLAGMPMAVRVVGSLHGLLFVLFALLVVEALAAGRLTLRQAAVAMVAAVLPFGPFVLEARLRREEGAAPAGAVGAD